MSVAMYKHTWAYVQIKEYCDGIQNYVSVSNENLPRKIASFIMANIIFYVINY